ncbi:hypothetical protein [Beijerinckia sp. L45]|uniref:hypothetical protein n=1 Tax=Beijerinckia sp. L45 TaxID=1641855 RepID=UPI00131BD226|nr:hypothetical protein [Beijerinckia sp. L45]
MVQAVDLADFGTTEAAIIKRAYSKIFGDLIKTGDVDETTQDLLAGSIIVEARKHVEAGRSLRHDRDAELIAHKVHEDLFGLHSL